MCISHTFIQKWQVCLILETIALSSVKTSLVKWLYGYQANIFHCSIALYFCSNSIIFIWAVSFSGEDNCCHSQGMGALIKEKLWKGIFRVWCHSKYVTLDFFKVTVNICKQNQLLFFGGFFFFQNDAWKLRVLLIHEFTVVWFKFCLA